MPFKLALFNVPFERRRQTACIILWASTLPLCLFSFFTSLLNPLMWPFLLAYVTYMVFSKAPAQGGRPLNWFRRLRLWKYCADYFPTQLVREAELDPSKNYIFGYHPHGIISVGAFLNFATEARRVSDVFPGLNIRLLTLTNNFHVPFYRDFLLSLNIASVSKHSIEHILNSGPGNACVVVVGGATESLYARPKQADLVLKRRLGFIKLAIKNGASLVPVFTFGENDIYDQVDSEDGSLLQDIQRKTQSYCGFTTPLFHGRGIFNYDLGLLPFRTPMVTVVGHPINVDKNPDPSMDDIRRVQQQYMDALQAIFDRYKDVYAKDRITDMRFVE